MNKLLNIGILLAAIALSGCGVEGLTVNKVQANLGEAERQAQLGNTAKAREWADFAVAVAPQTWQTYIYDPTQPETHPCIATVFRGVGDDASVVKYMQEAAAKFPQNPWVLQFLEESQDRLGDEAGKRKTAVQLAALLKAKIKEPRTVPTSTLMCALAHAEWEAGDTKQGELDYRSTIRVNPEDWQAPNELAYAYAVANDTAHLAEAKTLAQTAVEKARKTPGSTDELVGGVQDTKGWVEYRLNDFSQAESDVMEGVSSNPRLAEVHYHLAMIYKAEGKTEAARTEFMYAVQLNKGYKAAQDGLASLPKLPNAH